MTTRQQQQADARRAQRMADAIARETPAEREQRLRDWLNIAESNPRWSQQADALRAALSGDAP